MNRALALLLTAVVATGCRGTSPAIDPFVGRTTVPPPGTGAAAINPRPDPYYSNPPGALAPPRVDLGAGNSPESAEDRVAVAAPTDTNRATSRPVDLRWRAAEPSSGSLFSDDAGDRASRDLADDASTATYHVQPAVAIGQETEIGSGVTRASYTETTGVIYVDEPEAVAEPKPASLSRSSNWPATRSESLAAPRQTETRRPLVDLPARAASIRGESPTTSTARLIPTRTVPLLSADER